MKTKKVYHTPGNLELHCAIPSVEVPSKDSGSFYFKPQGGSMKAQQVLPFVLMCIDLGAAIVYGYCDGMAEWRKVVYWVAAASLTYVVTF